MYRDRWDGVPPVDDIPADEHPWMILLRDSSTVDGCSAVACSVIACRHPSSSTDMMGPWLMACGSANGFDCVVSGVVIVTMSSPSMACRVEVSAVHSAVCGHCNCAYLLRELPVLLVRRPSWHCGLQPSSAPLLWILPSSLILLCPTLCDIGLR